MYCVITPENYAQSSMHRPALQQQHHPQHSNGAYHLQGQQQRRPSSQQAQSPIGLGGLGGSPGLGLSGHSRKSGLTLDRILNRLENELQKSRETGSELNSLASVMTDISENLAGGALVRVATPLSLPPMLKFPLALSHQATSALTSHRYRASLCRLSPRWRYMRTKCESATAEHEHVKQELTLMRELMDRQKVEMETLIGHSRVHINGDHDKDVHDTDNDAEEDTRSSVRRLADNEVGRKACDDHLDSHFRRNKRASP